MISLSLINFMRGQGMGTVKKMAVWQMSSAIVKEEESGVHPIPVSCDQRDLHRQRL